MGKRTENCTVNSSKSLMNLAKCMVFHLNEGEEFAKQITSSSDNATQFIQGFQLGVLVF